MAKGENAIWKLEVAHLKAATKGAAAHTCSLRFAADSGTLAAATAVVVTETSSASGVVAAMAALPASVAAAGAVEEVLFVEATVAAWLDGWLLASCLLR